MPTSCEPLGGESPCNTLLKKEGNWSLKMFFAFSVIERDEAVFLVEKETSRLKRFFIFLVDYKSLSSDFRHSFGSASFIVGDIYLGIFTMIKPNFRKENLILVRKGQNKKIHFHDWQIRLGNAIQNAGLLDSEVWFGLHCELTAVADQWTGWILHLILTLNPRPDEKLQTLDVKPIKPVLGVTVLFRKQNLVHSSLLVPPAISEMVPWSFCDSVPICKDIKYKPIWFEHVWGLWNI